MEREELKGYLKDVFELEKQIYTYQQIIAFLQKQKLRTYDDLWWEYEAFEENVLNYDVSLGFYDKLTLKDGSRPKNKSMSVRQLESYLRDKWFRCDDYWSYDAVKGLFPPRWKEVHDYLEEVKKKETEFILKNGTVPVLMFDIFKKHDKYVYLWRKEIGALRKEKLLEVVEQCIGKDNQMKEEFNNGLQNGIDKVILPMIKQIELVLQNMYSQNIIHPKYRGLIIIAQIYEYIDTGRCSELEGPNGAYNLYESELRQNIIIDKLDTIIDELEQLNRTMSFLVDAMIQTKSLLGGISSQLRNIESNTALTAYNTSCTAYNTEVANRYNLY